MKIITLFLLTLCGLITQVHAQDVTEQELIQIVYEYQDQYRDKTVSLDELVNYFVTEIRAGYEFELAEGNRFTALSVELVMNAPMSLENISKIYKSNCDKLDNAFLHCIHIEGIDTSRTNNKRTKVILGFRQEGDEWKIAGYFDKTKNGSSRFIPPTGSEAQPYGRLL